MPVQSDIVLEICHVVY